MTEFAKRTMLATGRNRLNVPLELMHRTAGEQLAGSRTITVKEAWGCLWAIDGVQFGQWFDNLADARAMFDARNVNA